MPKLTPAEVAEWLAASCAAQGVPVRVADPQALAAVAALLPPPVAGPEPREAREGTAPARRHTRQTACTREESSDRAPD